MESRSSSVSMTGTWSVSAKRSRYVNVENYDPNDFDQLYHLNSRVTSAIDPAGFRSQELLHDGQGDLAGILASDSSASYPMEPSERLDSPDWKCLSDISLTCRRSVSEPKGCRIDMKCLSMILSAYAVQHNGLRLTPSGGALYPLSLYVLRELEDGDYRLAAYNPSEHSLVGIRLVSRESALSAYAGAWLGDSPKLSTAIFISGSLWRAKAKYGALAYRLINIEAGALAQTMQVIASNLGVHSRISMEWFEDHLDELLNLDGRENFFVTSLIAY